MIKIQTNFQKRAGFSLPEVMVAVAILATVVVAVTSLLVSVKRANTGNSNRLMAYYLAQEGLEGIRNIRDSNWLQGVDWQGKDENGQKLWSGSAGIVAKVGTLEAGNYVISPRSIGRVSPNLNVIQSVRSNGVEDVKDYVPWSLMVLTGSECPLVNADAEANYMSCDATRLWRYDLEEMNFFTHDQNLSLVNAKPNKSRFARWIEITKVSGSGEKTDSQLAGSQKSTTKTQNYDDLRIRVKSVVVWEESGNSQRLELTTELTDWKQGPL